MKALLKVGYRLGQRGDAWARTPPEDREVGDHKGDHRAEITKRASDFHAIEAVSSRLRYGGIRCHVAHQPGCSPECTMRILIAAVIFLFAGSVLAQEHQHKHAPYAGMQAQAVKALSDQQLADLRAGRGMGLALAAELNGYPGPLHVIELADKIGLSADQRQRVQQLYEAMKVEAISVGQKLISDETALDRAFKDRSITPDRLAELSAAIGKTQGELRGVHLKYHLITAELLSPDQIRQYSQLRGYH
jgi:hypothetical protein